MLNLRAAAVEKEQLIQTRMKEGFMRSWGFS